MRRGADVWVILGAALVVLAAAWALTGRPDRTGTVPTVQTGTQREPDLPPTTAAAENEQGEPATDTSEPEQVRCPEGEMLELSPGILPPGELRRVRVKRQAPEVRLELVGEVEYNRDRLCRISTPVSGKVVSILRHQGETVRAGEVLQILDSAEMGRAKADYLIAGDEYALAQAERERQRLLYKSREQILKQVEAGVTAEEALRLMRDAPLGDRKSAILTAVAEVEYAQNERERARLLFEQKIGARKNLLRADKELTDARIRLTAVLEETTIEAQQVLLEAETAERMKRASLEQAREELTLLGLSEEQIQELEREPGGRKSMVPIAAPFDGTVVDQYVSLGEIVDPATYLYKLADLSTVWVRADVFEKDLSALSLGKEVSITVPACPGRQFSGKIVYISSEVDQEKRTVAARIEVDNSKGELKPGMFCSGSVAVGSREGQQALLVVPASAVQDVNGTATVFVPCGENRFVAVPVVTGDVGSDWVAIASGLREGDVVVAEGSFILKSDLMKGTFRKGYED